MFRVDKFESNGSRVIAWFTNYSEAIEYVEVIATDYLNWKQEYKISEEDVAALEASLIGA